MCLATPWTYIHCDPMQSNPTGDLSQRFKEQNRNKHDYNWIRWHTNSFNGRSGQTSLKHLNVLGVATHCQQTISFFFFCSVHTIYYYYFFLWPLAIYSAHFSVCCVTNDLTNPRTITITIGWFTHGCNETIEQLMTLYYSGWKSIRYP